MNLIFLKSVHCVEFVLIDIWKIALTISINFLNKTPHQYENCVRGSDGVAKRNSKYGRKAHVEHGTEVLTFPHSS